jgi:hypothetical protein
LQDGYTIAQIQIFLLALDRNRQQDLLDRAETVWLGIAQAFNPEAGILKKLRQALANPESLDGGRDARPTPQLSPAAAAFFGEAPVLTKGK